MSAARHVPLAVALAVVSVIGLGLGAAIVARPDGSLLGLDGVMWQDGSGSLIVRGLFAGIVFGLLGAVAALSAWRGKLWPAWCAIAFSVLILAAIVLQSHLLGFGYPLQLIELLLIVGLTSTAVIALSR